MRSFWSDPFLWIHLAGLAVLPIWLELCLLGLAVGDPVLPFWLELLLVAALGIGPIFWMQWTRPFYIFSLIAVTLKPERLSENERRLLTLFKGERNRLLAIAVSVLLFLVLRQLYYLAPIASSITPFSSRWVGLLVAAIAFLGCNLFTQVPVSVLSVMLTGDSKFTTTQPFSTDQIRQNFTQLGLPVNQILPPIVSERELKPSVPAPTVGISDPLATPPSLTQVAQEGTPEPVVPDPWLTPSAATATGNPPVEETIAPPAPEPPTEEITENQAATGTPEETEEIETTAEPPVDAAPPGIEILETVSSTSAAEGSPVTDLETILPDGTLAEVTTEEAIAPSHPNPPEEPTDDTTPASSPPDPA